MYWNWYKNHCQRTDQITSSIAEQLVMRAVRVAIQIDWSVSSRQKAYKETYTMYENVDDDIFINKICSILKTKPSLMGL